MHRPIRVAQAGIRREARTCPYDVTTMQLQLALEIVVQTRLLRSALLINLHDNQVTTAASQRSICVPRPQISLHVYRYPTVCPTSVPSLAVTPSQTSGQKLSLG